MLFWATNSATALKAIRHLSPRRQNPIGGAIGICRHGDKAQSGDHSAFTAVAVIVNLRLARRQLERGARKERKAWDFNSLRQSRELARLWKKVRIEP
jgi:hypothetical protein